MEQVSVQAFNDEDPRGRRTLGKFHIMSSTSASEFDVNVAVRIL